MARVFDLDIITPERAIYKGKAVSLIVPTDVGYMGVLRDHAPLVASLGKGNITIKDPEMRVTKIDSSGNGFLEVTRKKVTILM